MRTHLSEPLRIPTSGFRDTHLYTRRVGIQKPIIRKGIKKDSKRLCSPLYDNKYLLK